MPLLSIKTSRQSTVAVWHTTEDLDGLQSGVTLTSSVTSTLQTCKPHRKKEILGTRHLLNYILAEAVTIIKDENGRPSIKEYPELNLSISHSGDYSAVMLSKYHNIGVDIQVHRANIRTIAPKFLYETEVESADINQLHYYWGIKESVFKAWSKGGVDFKSMIQVSQFQEKNGRIDTAVMFDNSETRREYLAQGKRLGDLYLTSVEPLEE